MNQRPAQDLIVTPAQYAGGYEEMLDGIIYHRSYTKRVQLPNGNYVVENPQLVVWEANRRREAALMRDRGGV